MSSEPDLLAALGRSIERARAHATTRQMRDSRPMTETPDTGDRVILVCYAGSTVHGTAMPGSDTDMMGVYIDPPEHLLGLAPSPDKQHRRTANDGERSGPGDTDLTMYALRKYVALAKAGNPSVLLPLFAPDESVLVRTPLGASLQMQAHRIVSRRAGHRHLGYLDAQVERMHGRGKQSRVPSRPELVEAHGFDTKYAAHALRLAYQGIELMRTGRISLPMPDQQRETVMAVRAGQVAFDDVVAMIDRQRVMLRLAITETNLPPQPAHGALNRWLVEAHQAQWREWQIDTYLDQNRTERPPADE